MTIKYIDGRELYYNYVIEHGEPIVHGHWINSPLEELTPIVQEWLENQVRMQLYYEEQRALI